MSTGTTGSRADGVGVGAEDAGGHEGAEGHEGRDGAGVVVGGGHGGHGPHGYSSHKADHLKRLRRIEGQVRGLQRMVEEDVYCIDILTQVSAGTKALQAFALSLLEEHIKHCVAAAVEEGGAAMDEKVAEAMTAISRLLRS
ncbi:hypothetical protein GCM10009665_18000 [Kitasatospora nipponensis]|uniref:DNA-binding FrmR family transcriptional regulator n=1 Tax=Kitasatospora nipponensis TaxID=258049 RepID=A0ABP4GQG7_9ACTN